MSDKDKIDEELVQCATEALTEGIGADMVVAVILKGGEVCVGTTAPARRDEADSHDDRLELTAKTLAGVAKDFFEMLPEHRQVQLGFKTSH